MRNDHDIALAKERSYFELRKPEWLRSHAGDFVVVSGETVAGFFPDYEGALKAGIGKFGIKREFLIKQVLEHERVFAIY